MVEKPINSHHLAGKVIDCHSHLGVMIKSFVNREYPYAQTAEGLYYRQISSGVDVNIVFPWAPELYCDLPRLLKGHNVVPGENPLFPVPYVIENEQIMTEVYRFCPEYHGRFITFVSADPGHEVAGQIEALQKLEKNYPIYGIKISPVFCQSPITRLLDKGHALVDFVLKRNIPMLIHSTVDPQESYSQVSDILTVARAYPDLRICIAHGAGFDREYLACADQMPNVWVDTSALKIQVELALTTSLMATPERRFEADYTNHLSVMQKLVEAFPDTILWGSDSPAYAYICRRKQAQGIYQEFRLKANYEDEKAALDILPPKSRLKVSNTNTLKFLFGSQP